MKKNNRGISLVEIIIAIAILAVCVIPLFSSLIQSGKLGLKSRRLLSATTAAESVMEDIKSTGVISYIKAAKSDTRVDSSSITNITNGTETIGYRLAYPDYQIDKRNFQVDVELTKYENSDDDKDYNSKDVVIIDSMDLSKDAIYVWREEYLNEDFSKALAKGIVTADQKETVLSNLQVYWDYTITTDTTQQIVWQTITFIYGSKVIGEHSMIIFDSKQAGNELEKLYICFKPNMANFINIYNTTDYPVEVYLVKQGEENKEINVTITGSEVYANLGPEKDPDFTKGIRIRTNMTDTDNVTYKYNEITLDDYKLENNFDLSTITKESTQTRLYNVKVTVSENNEVVTEMTGSATR